MNEPKKRSRRHLPLCDLDVRNAKATGQAYKLSDRDGLYLDVGRTGRRMWRYAFRFEGKQTTVTLGEYPQLSLKDAHSKHSAAYECVRAGKHPDHEHQAERERRAREAKNTFETLAREWIAEKLKGKSDVYREQIGRALARHVYPVIGKRPITAIEAPEVLAILRTIEGNGTLPMALLIRQWVGAVFRYGIATARLTRNPVADLKGAMPMHKVKHARSIEPREIPEFIKALHGKSHCGQLMRLYFWLLLLTFVRPSELREAKWSEVDWQAGLWRIPPERTKSRRGHLVPLSAQVTAKLEELRTFTGMREFLFPNKAEPTVPMTRMAPREALKRLKWTDRITPHGFRSLACTALNEMGWRPDVIEAQLGHAERDTTRAAYNRAAYLPDRTRMMQFWADFVMNDNVVPFKATA